ncbi:MAG: hypothetical protein LUE31_05305 [Lachnospiraceae bacterium]|nr:hypothetical protein [Lachnospiraceae bacterium]
MKLSLNLSELKKRRRELILPIALMAGLLVILFVVVQLLGRAERVTINEPLYQYVFEQADSYPDGVAMKKTEDTVMIDYGHQTTETNGYPFYYRGQDKLILTDDFLYLMQTGDFGGRVQYFTTISGSGTSYLLDDGESGKLTGGMLHDGSDVYIFLEDTEIEYNGLTKEISGFSYVVCFQGESILIWNYGDAEATYAELDESGAMAYMENGIDVDLVNDIYYKPNGTKYLLFNDPAIFDPVSAE